MMEDIRTIYRSLLRSDGIGQLQRLPAALEEDYVKLEDLSVAQQILKLHQLSKELRFYNTDLSVGNDWSALFKRFRSNSPPSYFLEDIDIENDLATSKNVEPALALLITFLKLLEHVKESLNRIPGKHMNFYYQDVLGFKPYQGKADKVHVLFDLTRNAIPLLIAAGTLLDAGKTLDGKELHYRTTGNIVVNQAKIVAVNSLFVEKYISEQTAQLWSARYDPQLLPETIMPFGSPQSKLGLTNRTMQYAVTGLALSSSLLELSGGDRSITMVITSEAFADQSPAFVDLKGYIHIEMTGEKGWITPIIETALLKRKGAAPDDKIGIITIKLNLSESLPAITAHNEEVHHGGYPGGTPVLRISTIPEIPIPDFFHTFTIAEATLQVDVKGFKNVIVQNEEGMQLANKPFNIFGSIPSLGDYFYLGSKEVFEKNLTALTINLKWKSPPADFVKYYSGYPHPLTFNSAVFAASLDILLDGSWTGHQLKNHFSLFNAQLKNYPLTLILSGSDLRKANNLQDIPRAADLPDLSEGYQPGVQRGFVRFTLTGPDFENFTAFGHSNFSTALTLATLNMVRFPGEDIQLPLPPYTPQVKEVTIDYSASDTIFPGSNDKLYHQTPFGIQLLKNKGATLFPSFPGTGYLYIGLSDLKPEQQVNLLFNLAEKSSVEFEGYDADFSTPIISWSYLSDDNWIGLRQDQILTDSTKQFQQSGIISLTSGDDATIINSSFPSSVFWLQATLKQGLNRVLPLSAIHTQAVEAILEIAPDQELKDFSVHLSTGLVPAQIKNNVQISPSLKSINQPYPSFAGVPPESDVQFNMRLSERLRHRKRAVHGWDFERLALEEFPGIAKVKCLAGNDSLETGTSQVIMVPQLNFNQPLTKRLQPKASSFYLDQVEEFLNNHTTFFTTVTVNNPDYEEVLTDFKVKFMPDFDPVYYLSSLNEDIVRFISPWAFGDNTALHFDSEIYRSEIMYFIEKLPYVDYIADFKLFHLNRSDPYSREVIGEMKIGKTFVVRKPPVPNIGGMKIGESFIIGEDWEVIAASQDSGILVSVPRHTIKTVDDQRICSGISGLGIGSMTIKLDFIVSKT